MALYLWWFRRDLGSGCLVFGVIMFTMKVEGPFTVHESVKTR